ncbi:MAG: FAD-dependent thymidylate synthase [Chloroflexi bacterium]|nr:FAD-dependent thymidylate synthase [Chloroflexota bacterium]
MVELENLSVDLGPLKGRVIKVLDKGFVQLLDYIGSDQRILDAARVSTGAKGGDPEKDRRLIFFLMEMKHGTPFEHLVFQFLIKCPIFVARQWMRHRVASYNERSARYRVFQEEFYVPSLEDIPDIFDEADLQEYEEVLKQEHAFYQRMIDKAKPHKELRKRTREVFRGVLGTSYYTEFYWTLNFRALMNFIELRTGEGAQPEIRKYALAISSMAQELAPLAYEAFDKYALNAAKPHV